jgi:hypothetical protein
MGSNFATTLKALEVSEEDISRVAQTSRKRRLATLTIGSVGAIASMVAGYMTARNLYYEAPVDDGGYYPFIPPLAAAGLYGAKSKYSVLGIGVGMITAFVLMFALTAAAYTPADRPAIMYGTWHKG